MAFDVNFLAAYDIDSIAAELRRIAALTGKDTVSSTDIVRYARVNVATIYLKFGSIAKANEAAGLAFKTVKILTNVEILRILVDLWNRTLEKEGRRPHQADLKKYGMPLSYEVVKRRFGTWKNALIAANNLPAQEVAELPVLVTRRSSISVRRRFHVFRRDGYECRICHRTGEPLELDHIVPVCQGGSSELDNLQTLCKECNRGKGGSLQ
jgi:hypothetical protein